MSAVAVLVSSCGGWGLHGTRLVVAWSTAPVSGSVSGYTHLNSSKDRSRAGRGRHSTEQTQWSEQERNLTFCEVSELVRSGTNGSQHLQLGLRG